MRVPDADVEAELASRRAEMARLELQPFLPFLRAIAPSISDNLILIDREHRIRFINWTVPGLTIEGVLGTSVTDYIPKSYHTTNSAAYDRAFETGEPARLKFEYFADDGAISRWETRIVPLPAQQNRIEHLLLVSTNFTEREEAAVDLDRFFRLSVDMLCVATLSGYFKRVSPAFTATLGWTAEELHATPFLDFVHEEDRTSTLHAVELLGRGETILDFENRYRVKSGGYRRLEWRAIADSPSGLVYAAARDVTERRELEAELGQARKMETVGQLAGGIAHDFNNLILAIGLNARLASRESAPRRDHLAEIQRAAERAADLTHQLLQFSRKQPVQPQPVDLNSLIADTTRMLRRTFPSNIAIDHRHAGGSPSVLADPAQLEQVLLNLCVNARDAMPGGGTITISTGRTRKRSVPPGQAPATPTQYVALSVADTGIGMTEEVQQRIFDPFFTTKPPGSGTGLGLATVYGIVQQHGGTIRVESQPGKGAVFEVLLPESDAAPKWSAAPSDLVRGGTETILVAEDYEHVRRVVVSLLESAGYRVIVAADGDEAMARVREHGAAIALAVLDVVMPARTGPEVAELAMQLNPNIRILFTSGYTQVPGVSAISEQKLLRKPYAPDELLRRVRRLLDLPIR